jgi:putative ABC transport system permease protein
MSVGEARVHSGAAEIRRQIRLPFKTAIRIAFNSIKIRFWRSMITAAGIFLGIAFFTSVRTSAVFADIQKEIIAQKKQAIASGQLVPTAEDIRLVNSAASSKAEEEGAANRLNWLSIMALIVCTVGIANAMLMSVTERYKEIGTMKCLGALDRLIVELFFIESCFLGFLASTFGFLLGWLVICLLRLVTDGAGVFNLHFWSASWWLLVSSVAIGTALTFLATIFPAWRAAQMPPAAALRVEI